MIELEGKKALLRAIADAVYFKMSRYSDILAGPRSAKNIYSQMINLDRTTGNEIL